MTRAMAKRNRKKDPPAKTVDEYLASLPRDEQTTLRGVRKAIKAAAPDADEAIRYRMPSYTYHGYLIFFAAFKDHLSLVPVGKSIQKRFSKELKPFEISGFTVHFSPGHPLPVSLIKRIVKARLEENLRRARLRARKGSK